MYVVQRIDFYSTSDYNQTIINGQISVFGVAVRLALNIMRQCTAAVCINLFAYYYRGSQEDVECREVHHGGALGEQMILERDSISRH